jgi:hypothetical protein
VWLPNAVAGFSFILNRLNLLASLNLLEKIRLCETVGQRSKQSMLDGRNFWA